MTPEIMIVATHPYKNSSKSIKRKTLFEKDHEKILDLNFNYPRFAHEYAYSSDKENLKDIINKVSSYETQIRDKNKLLIKMFMNRNQKNI
jgi:hypothetical protein